MAANAGGAPGSAMPQAATMHVRRVNVVVHAITKSAVEFAMLREEDVREGEQRAGTGGESPPTLYFKGKSDDTSSHTVHVRALNTQPYLEKL